MFLCILTTADYDIFENLSYSLGALVDRVTRVHVDFCHRPNFVVKLYLTSEHGHAKPF